MTLEAIVCRKEMLVLQWIHWTIFYLNIFWYKYSLVSYSYHSFVRIYSDMASRRFVRMDVSHGRRFARRRFARRHFARRRFARMDISYGKWLDFVGHFVRMDVLYGRWPGRAPKWSGRAPKWSGRVPKWSGRVPKWSGRVPKWSSRVPKWSGTVPKWSGRAPKWSGRAPKWSGSLPANWAPLPQLESSQRKLPTEPEFHYVLRLTN